MWSYKENLGQFREMRQIVLSPLGKAKHQNVRWGGNWQWGWKRCWMLGNWCWLVGRIGQAFWWRQHITKLTSVKGTVVVVAKWIWGRWMELKRQEATLSRKPSLLSHCQYGQPNPLGGREKWCIQPEYDVLEIWLNHYLHCSSPQGQSVPSRAWTTTASPSSCQLMWQCVTFPTGWTPQE